MNDLALITQTPAPLILTTGAGIVPCGTVVFDVAKYLETRKPCPDWSLEPQLFARLPDKIRDEVKALQAAFKRVADAVKHARLSVERACRAVLDAFRTWPWSFKTFRNKYDAWARAKDWLVLANRAKSGADFQAAKDALPVEFLRFCAGRIGEYKRNDARKEAFRSVLRQWHTGKSADGQDTPIPGYGFKRDWLKTDHQSRRPDVPDGWTYSTVLRQINKRALLPEAARRLLLQGTKVAQEAVPQVHGTREGLRFLEEVQFDDVKTDWRIFDPASGQAQDLWLLIARDRATAMLLGFGMRPARARDDGTQEHLQLRDMKQLCGWILERYGLPPYPIKWKIERGTATLSQGSAEALQELLPGRIKISFSSMIGGTSPNGYFERRIGNSKGKASLESHNRGMHLIGAALPGQTGPSYGARPADLAAREKECQEIALLSDFLPENLRGKLGFSLLTLAQARENLFQIFTLQNRRDDHTMEGFSEVLEWWDGNEWKPSAECGVESAELQLRKRMEMPVERAARMVREVEAAGGVWTRVSPDVITAFYKHTQRPVKINERGEIEFRHENKVLVFAPPSAEAMPASILRAPRFLGYYHPDDPTYLHLTDGQGAIVGTWLQRGKVRNGDTEALSRAMEYQRHALKAAQTTAEELAAPGRAALDVMRADNAVLLKDNGFVEVTDAPQPRIETAQSGVAAGLRAVRQQRAAAKQAAATEQDEAALAREILMGT